MANRAMVIRDWESEYKPILDTEQPSAEIKRHLGPWLRIMRDIANYGAKLIPRCITSCDRKLEDAILIAILLRQCVAMLDTVEALLSVGAVHTSNLQMRSLFEASVYIDWILAGDAEKKANYYYVHNLRRKRLWALRTQTGSAEWQEFQSIAKDSGAEIDDHIKGLAKEQIREVDRILSQSAFAAIDKDFDQHRKGRRNDAAWYVPLGQRNLSTMSAAVGRKSLYALLYSGASDVMHTSNYGHHIKFGENVLTVQPIRSAEGFETVFRFSLGIALHTFMKILDKYRPGERKAFSRKYAENWRQEFMNFPKIIYKAETMDV